MITPQTGTHQRHGLSLGHASGGSLWFALLYVICYILSYIVTHCIAFGDIMKTEMLSTRIDADTKLAFTNLCEDMGISPSQALKLFAKAVVNYGGIPFELKVRQPNEITAAAIAELEAGNANSATDIEQLFSDVNIGKLDDA